MGLGTLFGPFLAACLQVFRCLVLWAFRKLAMVGRSVPTGLGTIKHHVAMFSGKQNVILLRPSRVITAVIIAIIFDAFSAKCKGGCFCYIFRVVCSVTFSLFVPYLRLNNYQKCDEDIVCRKSSPCLFSQWLWGACERLLSQLLISEAGANVWSDLCGEKRGCANIILAVWVNFCTLSCIWLHDLLPYWLVLRYHLVLYQPR